MSEFIPMEKADVRLLGRTVFGGGARILGYSLSGVEFDFCGTSLSAELATEWVKDEPWKEVFKPFVAVLADGELISRFSVGEGTGRYEIFSCEKPRSAVIRILKLSENSFSRVMLKGFYTDGRIKATAPKSERKIEFVGDSITCGFGIEAYSASEGFSTATENPLINYASLTARAFDAEYNLVSWTAIGVYSNSVKDESVTEPDNGWTMPVIYDYADKAADGLAGIDPPRKWDFSSFVPDLIVVNIGTNDKDFTRGIPERTAAFESTYRDFISHIRELNPDSYILCVLGVMGQELCPQVENAVRSLNDGRISALRFPVQDEADGIGAEWHPSAKTHRKMSDILIAEIKRLGIFEEKD